MLEDDFLGGRPSPSPAEGPHGAGPARAVAIAAAEDCLVARSVCRMLATNLGLDALDVALLMAATSELARGVLRHAGGGEMTFSQIARGWRRGLRIVASGKPATASREDALDITAYSSMQRVADEFGVRPGPGWAMVATAVKWLPRPLELALTGS